MSSLDPLIDVLGRAKATELRLVPGERTYVIRKGRRVDVGRDVVQQGNVSLLAAEVIGPARVLAAHDGPQSARISRLGYTLDLIASVGGAGLEVTLRVVDFPEGVDPGPPSGSMPVAPLTAPPSRRPSKVLELDAPPIDVSIATMSLPHIDGDVTLAPQQASLGSAPVDVTVARAAVSVSDRTSIDALLRDVVAHQASDLHLAAGFSPVMRIQGELHFLTDLPETTLDQVQAHVDPILGERARRELAAHKRATFTHDVKDVGRFRVVVHVDRRGLAATFTHVPSDIPALERYGFPGAIVDVCSGRGGVLLVASPPGHGKTTTLSSIVDYVNWTRSDHVITLERPIEHVHAVARCLLSQREVGEHAETFAGGLADALREHPDVLVLGELPDAATIRLALEAAQSGALVLATTQAPGAVAALERLVDAFPSDQQPRARALLADVVKAVVAQVLCWRVAGGRAPALEVLLSTPVLAAMVREGKWSQVQPNVQGGRHAGMIAMADALAELVAAGEVTSQEAWSRAADRTALAAAYKARGIALPT